MVGSKILVYHYRHEGSPLVKGGLAVIEQAELVRILEKRKRHLHCTLSSYRSLTPLQTQKSK